MFKCVIQLIQIIQKGKGFMSDKDFLSQFENNEKPDSFKKEERTPVQKQPIKWGPIVAGLGILAVAAVGAYFLFFAPKIVMPNFVGQSQSDVATWVRQQGIDSTGIVMKSEYNFDNDEGTILSQSVEEGTKVGKDAKIDFVVSLGADPDELVTLPDDIKSMSKSELQDFINNNKLTKAKITTSYSDTVAEGEVISYEVKGVDSEADFTRSTTLNITISKGPEPATQVTVSDFVGKSQSEAESWASTNGVKVTVVEGYSSKDSGTIYAQEPVKNTKIKKGDSITIYVSKGEGVTVPNLLAMTSAQAKDWIEGEGKEIFASIDPKAKYYNYTGEYKYVISQSIPAGSVVEKGETLTLGINLGNYFYAADEGLGTLLIAGADYNRLVDQCNAIRYKGIDAFADNWTTGEKVYSDEYSKDEIVSVICSSYSSGQVMACDGPLPLDVRFDVVISKGLVSYIDKNDSTSVNDLMKALADRTSFKLDDSVTQDKYLYPGKIVKSDGSEVDTVNDKYCIYEDQVYKIVLNGSAPLDPEVSTSTPTAEVTSESESSDGE